MLVDRDAMLQGCKYGKCTVINCVPLGNNRVVRTQDPSKVWVKWGHLPACGTYLISHVAVLGNRVISPTHLI